MTGYMKHIMPNMISSFARFYLFHACLMLFMSIQHIWGATCEVEVNSCSSEEVCHLVALEFLA